MKKTASLIILLTSLLALPSAFAQEAAPGQDTRPGVEIAARDAEPRLVDMAVASAVAERQPQDPGDTFPADVDTLYCWTAIHNTGEPTKVQYVWRHGDQTVTTLTVSVGKSIRWRSWTRQRTGGRTGAWSCEILDESGASLGKATVTVQ